MELTQAPNPSVLINMLLRTKNQLNQTLLKLFGRAIPVEGKITSVPFSEMNKLAVRMGYLVHVDLCIQDVYQWLIEQKTDLNSTFYKSWGAVISKNRFELYVDQLLHYASTYGTDRTGEVYLPEGEITNVPEFTKFKVILPIHVNEAISRCEKLLYSGIALKQETIEDIFVVFNALGFEVDVEKVKNKEAKMFLYQQTGALPKDPVEMVRYLVYLATGKTLLIKDKETIDAIKASKGSISGYVSSFGYEKLASVFYRFKPIFLAFKHMPGDNVQCINKLRRLAVKHHQRSWPTYFETLLNSSMVIYVLPEKLKGISNFKKIALLQAILVRSKNLNLRVFGIRNGKLYIKQVEHSLMPMPGRLNKLFEVIYADLVQSLKHKACTINIPDNINLTLPTSEKSFIGNYPIGTSFDFSDSDNIVGIHWRGEDGADDLDLKLIDISGTQYGWNAAYYNEAQSIIFSGDMTSANPEATELFYASKGFNPAIVKVSLFDGEKGSKFRFFLAKEKVEDGVLRRGYMVNPANIVLSVEGVMDSSEKCLGVIAENKFILAQFRTGRGKVATGKSVTNLYTDYALQTLNCYLSLNKLLVDAGFTITSDNPKIDLANLSKDTLIDLIS